MTNRRPVTVADDAFLRRVYASTRAEELARVPWTDAQKSAFLNQQFDAQARDYRSRFPEAAYEVIEIDGVPAGRLYVDPRADEVRVLDIALLPEHRGQGHGARLLKEVIVAAGERAVSVHVERNNPARRLYERLGFEVKAEHGLYLLMIRQPKTAS